jgi:hypothetical protein
MLKCTNCRCDVPKQAEIYRAIVLCADCYKVAIHKEESIDHELRSLKTAAIECIRMAAIEHKLLLGTPPVAEPPAKNTIVQSMLGRT